MPNYESDKLRSLKWYRRLDNKKCRLEAGAFLVEGERAVRQVISVCPERITEIVTVEGQESPFPSYPRRIVTASQFRNICHGETPQGILAAVSFSPELYSARLPQDIGDRVLLLEDVQDPGNVGALIRTAAALDFSGVILTDKCADPLSPKSVQSTAGAVLSVWLRRTSRYLEFVEELKSRGYCFAAADLDGNEDMSSLSECGKLLFALGNEAEGLSQEILDVADYRLKVSIKQEKVESLNVAACGAICMYLASREG